MSDYSRHPLNHVVYQTLAIALTNMAEAITKYYKNKTKSSSDFVFKD